MIRTQKWTPDTCANPATGDACVMLETWDDAVPPEARTHNFAEREKACSWHAAEIPANGYGRCVSENRRKNMAFTMALGKNPNLKYEEYKWALDANGVLTVTLGALLTNQQKNQLRSEADIQFGPGKVVVL